MTMTMMMALTALQAAASGAAPATAAPHPAPAPPVRPSGHGAAPATTGGPVAPVAASSGSAEPQPAALRPDRAHVLAAVNAEWRRYDTSNRGRLGPLEFATWVMRANGAAVAPAGIKGAAGIKPVSAMNATARAFARADANHDGGVTPDEMTDFLLR